MKFLLMFLICLYIKNANAGQMQCSANGTDVYYINGVLTNKTKNKSDADAIGELFKFKKEQLDLKKNVNFIGIHNPSFGLINDVAELFSQAYYAKTGKNDGKVIFNLIQNMPDALTEAVTGLDPNNLGTTLGMFGIKTPSNFATLKFSAKENFQTALERSLASTETLLAEKDVVINSIANGVIKSKKGNRKILFVAHSQGNAALNAAIKKLTVANAQGEVEYMQKYMGAYHVASPVLPLGIKGELWAKQFKSRDIRLDLDHVISAAQLFSDNFIPPEFKITTAPVTHNLIFRKDYSDLSGHFFADTYISEKVFARPINRNDTPITMSENFVNTLSDLATDLEDNCDSTVVLCNAGLLPNTMNFTLEGNVDFSLNHIFPASGINSDPHTCECHEVNLKEGGNTINVSGSGSFGTANYELVPFKGTIYGTGGRQYFSTSVDFVNGQLQVGVVEGIYATNYCGPFVYKN